mmetsp:Transcript_28047/g.92237  ORF Transcript_28047/g.92237 Transcript_28047/m.92237 type:complete len:848 (+) Transcript_28047:858-3401(+)
MRTLSRFAFVGLLDNWSWTVHQFGRRFGVPLLPSDYKVLRAGSKSRSSSPRQKMAEQTLRAFSFAADDALVSATSDSLGVHRRLQSQQTQMRIAWLEIPHYSEGYYDALQQPLSRLGHRVDELRAPTQRGFGPGVLATKLRGMDIAVVGFGWFPQEPGSGPFTRLHEFQRSCAASHRVRLEAAGEFESTTRRACLCGTVPLVVILNKEYASLADKMAWVREHCVAAAFSVHHDAPTFAQMTGVDFHHIPFGVDFSRFARGQRAEAGRAVSDGYAYDLGFTGVIRPDQTANWRYRIWRSAWPILAERGLRLYSGGEGGVGLGRRHKSVGPKEYVAKMQASKVWLATTGPADLVGTRYSEIMATGTTLCVCNRLHGNATAAYARLGLVEGRHVVMFDSLEEFVEVVTNYTRRPEYERRRLAIIRRAQALARRRLSWRQVAASVDAVLQGVARGGRGALRERRTTGRRGGGGDKASGGGAGGGGVEGGGGGVGPFGGNAPSPAACGVSLVSQHSFARCALGSSFGCVNATHVFVRGCRGLFRCDGGADGFACGYPPGRKEYECGCDGRADDLPEDDTLPECTVYSSASQAFTPGLEVLLASMRRRSGLACSAVLYWHPLVPDSMMTAAQLDRIKCAAGQLHVSLARADDGRVRRYAAVRGPSATAQSLLRVETLHEQRGGLAIWLDADMLVVGSLRPIAHAVLRATRQWRWQLHGSQLAAPGAYNYLNAGFMAFRAPAPAALLRAVDAQLDKMVGEARFHPTPSQNLLNDVLPLGGWLTVHYRWKANYRPQATNESLARWRVVHWQGLPKPWGSPIQFDQGRKQQGMAPPSMGEAWAAEHAELRRQCPAQ